MSGPGARGNAGDLNGGREVATGPERGRPRALRWARSRGAFFWLNVVTLAPLVMLVTVLLDYQSADPTVGGRYSVEYAIYLSTVIAGTVVYALLIFVGNARFNRHLFVIVLVAFVVGEGIVRVFEARKPYRQDLYRAPQPYVMFTGLPNGSVAISDNYKFMGGEVRDAGIQLNRLGFRGDLPSKAKAGEYRVIMLGGSTVFNGVPLSESLAGRLETFYRSGGRTEARVYNWGVVSAVSGQELALLVHRVVDYSPDLVIVYDGANDVGQPYWYDPRPGYPYNFIAYEAALAQLTGRGGSLGQHLAVMLIGNSELMRLGFGRTLYQIIGLSGLRRHVGYLSKAWEHEIVAAYLANIAKMCAIGGTYGFRVVVFLQPVVLFKSQKMGREGRFVGPADFQALVRSAYGDIRRGFEALNRERSDRCRFVDFSHVLADVDRELYWDFVHVSNDGNRLIAEQMYRYLNGGAVR